jgi:hypothetical protein
VIIGPVPVVPTFTLTAHDALWLFWPEAVMVYVVVCAGVTVKLPLIGMLPPTVGVTVTDVAFCVWYETVELWPALIVDGVAVQPDIVVPPDPLTTTVAVAFCEPLAPVAVS